MGRKDAASRPVTRREVLVVMLRHAGMIASVVTEHPQPPAAYKARLAGIAGLSHVTIEVQPCPDHVPHAS